MRVTLAYMRLQGSVGEKAMGTAFVDSRGVQHKSAEFSCSVFKGHQSTARALFHEDNQSLEALHSTQKSNQTAPGPVNYQKYMACLLLQAWKL